MSENGAIFRPMLRALLVAGFAVTLPARLTGQDIGALTIQAGAASSLAPSGDGIRPAIVGDLSFFVGRMSFGPEIGVYFTGADSLSPNSRPESAATFGGVARFQLSRRTWRVQFVSGLGFYAWDSIHPAAPTGSYLSGSFGLGLRRATSARGSALQTELRLHQVLQHTGVPGTRRFVAFSVGYAFGW